MAVTHLTSQDSPQFPQVYTGELINSLIEKATRAVVHLNFDEPDQARDLLLEALNDYHFSRIQEGR